MQVRKLTKSVVFLVILYLTGCTIPAKEQASLEAQRDFFQQTLSPTVAGYQSAEAKQFLEFCIELNDQDSRNSNTADPDGNFKAKPGNWQLVYDSRNPSNHEWNKSYQYDGDHDDKLNPNNPAGNGFGPFNNAWLLARNPDTDEYVIAIRGTVGELAIILDDVYATTIPAFAGILDTDGRRLPITFAATTQSEVHLGFAYGSYSLLFDRQKGILANLKKFKIPKLTIAGHSQGAAIATLIHAFLYYALTDKNDPYQLQSSLNLNTAQGLNLKSYVYAQPKPGNLQFAEDFARIARNVSFVINNSRDPIPQVPLSHESTAEVAIYIEQDNYNVGGVIDRDLSDLTDTKNSLVNSIYSVFTRHVSKRFDNGSLDLSYFQNQPNVEEPWLARSLNYTLAGQLIPVFGLTAGLSLYPIAKNSDFLLQHHATSYRKLLALAENQ